MIIYLQAPFDWQWLIYVKRSNCLSNFNIYQLGVVLTDDAYDILSDGQLAKTRYPFFTYLFHPQQLAGFFCVLLQIFAMTGVSSLDQTGLKLLFLRAKDVD
jgi:hypothetical protein